ncbi:conserved hypothetical protein [Verticillium alfalfae VaMs.102]|uniref:Uncharacterized protein n=1 Tax=Verticillium alfalfae (strain VaMs.102 / ATCC MYA-4576 / FGSC 10136) TaxID=526221 RepID=C9S8S2_VERA1|nr:conserved hypothetical protein [Verticillium alfalfae VaMs.102]EEY13999.1 conserved hypothetical protein [Verticillium alfalfae VaMs.102]
MASDSVIWEIINTQFCAFKIQSRRSAGMR